MSSFVRSFAAAVALLAAFGSLACEALVPSSLDSVACTTPNVVGSPACPAGQICAHSACIACGTTELCGNGIDDDCDGAVDDGCFALAGGFGGQPGAGGGGGAGGSVGGGSLAGSGGVGASGAGTGGEGGESGGHGGEAGDTSEGGAAGTTGGAGTSGDGGMTTAGTGGVPMGGSSSGGGGGADTLGYGDDCSGGGACPSDAFCLDWSELGETMSGEICTKPCCSSAQCGSALTAVCWPTPSGGGMCVPGASVGRGDIGQVTLGNACSDSEAGMFCRSGFCDGGACNDVCCHDSNCAAAPGTQCVKNYLTDVPPIRYGYQCGPPKGSHGYADPTSPCIQDSSCESYACDLVADALTFCAKDCCTSNECGTANFFGDQFQIACVYTPSSNGYVRSCAAASDSWGGGQLGAPCLANEDCATDYCVLPDGYCSDTCCTDDDCGGDPFHCKPYQSTGSGIGVFRCIK